MIDSTQLESWYASPKGAYVLNAQAALIRNMTASWKRRDHLVLEIGTGAGRTAANLWECGFTVTGVENNLQLLDKAQASLNNKGSFHFSNLTHLPYDDKAFDYVVLSSALLTATPLEPLLDETLRLASKSILLFWKNSFSLHGAYNTSVTTLDGQTYRLQQYSPLRLIRYIQKHCPQCTWKFRTILLGSAYTWRHVPYFFAFNALSTPIPLGSFACLRIDQGTTLPLTGRPLLTRNQKLAGACSQD